EAEAALRESQWMLERAQEVAQVGSWVTDLTPGGPGSWSAETHRIRGTDPARITPTFEGFLERVHPADRERVREAWTAAVSERKPYRVDHRVLRPDGTVCWVHGEAALVAGGTRGGRRGRRAGPD